MQMSLDEIRQGLRDGTLAFCLPAAHAEFSAAFLDDFSQRVLKRDWREISMGSRSRVPTLLEGQEFESEDDIVATIEAVYGADVSDLPGLPFWEVLRRCASAANKA